MKKLLTLLLTLVLAICLINLNNNHSKAEEANADTHADCDTTPGTCVINATIMFDGTKLYYNGTSHTPRTDMIDFVDGIITIKQNISITNNTLLDISSDSVIKLDKDISLTVNSDGTVSAAIRANVNDITINGDYHKLIMRNDNCIGISCKKLTLNNVVLDIKNTTGGNNINFTDLLVLNNSKMKLESPTSAHSIHGPKTSPIPETISMVKGSSSPTGTLEDASWGIMWDSYSSFQISGNVCRKIEINEPDAPFPSDPTPSPSKKDESCEKVIGPTWHWNNEKGVCEEYATVGTSTRGIDSK